MCEQPLWTFKYLCYQHIRKQRTHDIIINTWSWICVTWEGEITGWLQVWLFHMSVSQSVSQFLVTFNTNIYNIASLSSVSERRKKHTAWQYVLPLSEFISVQNQFSCANNIIKCSLLTRKTHPVVLCSQQRSTPHYVTSVIYTVKLNVCRQRRRMVK